VLRVILDANNDLPSGGPKLAEGAESVRTAYQAVFGTQQGEWRYDKTFGTQWRPVVLRKYFDATATAQLMARTASTVPETPNVTQAQVDIDTTSSADFRQADITIEDVVIGGETVTIVVTTEI